MQLKNVLIVVNDIERSKKFYKDIFGLEVILDNEGNVILTGGLVLQDATIWAEFIENLVIPHNNASSYILKKIISRSLHKNLMSRHTTLNMSIVS